MPLTEQAYKSNIATVKKFGEKYKLTFFKFPLRTAGVELPSPKLDTTNVCSQKLDNSLSRTRATVFELAACNDWEHFVTLTLSPEKYDRFNLPAFRSDLSQWLRNQRRIKGSAIRYLLLPEQHKDGAWHMHGLLAGIPQNDLSMNTNGYLDYPIYGKKFGYISLSKIRSKEKISKYITKYISKNLMARREEVNAHLFYASKGLNHAELLHRGYYRPPNNLCPDYDNDYVLIKWFDSFDEAVSIGFD